MTHRKPWADLSIALLLGLLMFAYCFPAPYATIWPDTVRDLAASLALARGERIPLVGAPINFGPYAGPAWIFLQAPPLIFSPAFVATSVYVAIVASLKFPALYELGRRISGRRLGLCIAIAAAYPSFAVYQWIGFFHPNWVEVAVAASLVLFLLADQRRSLGMVYAAIVMLGLAVQIHTTTLFYFPLAAVVLYRLGVRGRRMALHLVAMALLIMLWFTPVLFAPPAELGPMQGAAHRVATDLSHFSIRTVGVAIGTALFDYPIAIAQTFGAASHVPTLAWRAGLVIVWLALLSGALLRLRERRTRLLFVFAAMSLMAAWIIAVGVRSFTSFYLVYFLLPLMAFVFGLCLESSVAAPWRWLRAVGHLACAALVLSLVVTAYGARSVGRSGLIDSRILAIGDLAHPRDGRVRGAYASVSARDELAKEACVTSGSSVTLHGELAYALSISQGLDYELHCPDRVDRFRIFGTGPGAHLAALPESVVPALGIVQDRPARGLRLIRSVRPIYPAEGRAFEKRFSYFERLSDRRPSRQVVVDFDAGPGELVAVYRHKPFDSSWRDFRVSRDGVQASPIYTTFDSWIYRVGDKEAHWRVEFDTDAPQWVELFLLGLG